MSDTTEPNYESYRLPAESDEHWTIKSAFIESYKNKIPHDRLMCLAQVFANIQIFGCRYPYEVMEEVSQLADNIRRSHKKNLMNTVEASVAIKQRLQALKRFRYTQIDVNGKKINPCIKVELMAELRACKKELSRKDDGTTARKELQPLGDIEELSAGDGDCRRIRNRLISKIPRTIQAQMDKEKQEKKLRKRKRKRSSHSGKAKPSTGEVESIKSEPITVKQAQKTPITVKQAQKNPITVQQGQKRKNPENEEQETPTGGSTKKKRKQTSLKEDNTANETVKKIKSKKRRQRLRRKPKHDRENAKPSEGEVSSPKTETTIAPSALQNDLSQVNGGGQAVKQDQKQQNPDNEEKKISANVMKASDAVNGKKIGQKKKRTLKGGKNIKKLSQSQEKVTEAEPEK